MSTTTMSYFKYLIIFENFFGISRPHLLEDSRTRLTCDAISISVIISITSLIILNFINTTLNIGGRIFELLICIEYYGIVLGSRFRQEIFNAIERLDKKCGVDEEYGSKIRMRSVELIFIFLPSVVIDVIGLSMLGIDTGFSIVFSVAFAAHDAEMAFASSLVETVNLRLEKLKTVSPNAGSRIYRHVLIATAHLSEQYTPRLLMMLAVTLITTIAYEFILVLADPKRVIYLSFYLLWRESRSMYSLWMMCSSIARSDTICDELSLYLAGRLTQDQSISKEINRSQHEIVQRWYSIVISQRPEYISGSILSIGLSTPILVLDLSINYMLIMVQMYLAYK